ncbi:MULTISPECIES: ABC transporter ATP-binding protein [unclassified Rhodococcus (in: high G+C Gram-positive bacteria)]|uniref:ABC transporter ATP-binding protein n=1 Tax=unclassified Rhodococcus (in: high G+C Gram-positive bacteria) TaxID=192944 RepID=UPI00163AAA7E|nr:MULTISPECIES: ABC transporter ATP-binding protein [unclassified Rhodococcus (in: high G+C Gram-positive bacteria)]MBC2644368.1 ABC transporter ATP-binding protein [Rhodococcus sp. 3A]MBC2897940.1 ABC transporter ATP-binding protein [Rhodococcus sp. 4CII]
MTLRAKNVGWSRGGQLVLDGVSIEPAPGETIGLLGPNGSGKSSLLRLFSGIAEPHTGRVLLGDTDIRTLRRRQIARRVAMVDQHSDTEVDITVGDIVRFGRIPHRGMFGGDETADAVAVEQALEHTGMTSKAHRLWHTLSGGERQRAQIARALAQEPDELLLDEPTNHLDIRHQLDILSLVAQLPLTSYVALHDLNLAAMFCDRVIVLDHGRVVAAGTPTEVITEALVDQVYQVRACVTVDPVIGYPTVTYRPQSARDPVPR